MKLKNSYCDDNQKLELWWKSETIKKTILKNSNWDKSWIVTKLKISNCDESQISNQDKSKKKKINCDRTQKHKLNQILIYEEFF